MGIINDRAKELQALLKTREGAHRIVGLYMEKVLAPGESIPNGMLVEEMIDDILVVEFGRRAQNIHRSR